MAEYRTGGDEGLTLEEVDALLAAATPLAFWRAKRGLTQAALAKAAKTTQPHIADLESGKHGGSLEMMARIAKALKVKLDDLAAFDANPELQTASALVKAAENHADFKPGKLAKKPASKSM